MKKISSIFIIDDDPITVFGIRKMLGLTVEFDAIETFGNGRLALDAIMGLLKGKVEMPEVIFLDINMPIMDGWQFLHEFIKLPILQKVRVNIVTSSIDPRDEEKWLHYKNKTHHIITYNNKPIKKNEIAEITVAA